MDPSKTIRGLLPRLNELVPNHGFTVADLRQCQTQFPQLYRLIQVSLQRETVTFEAREFIDERVRVQKLNDGQIGALMRAAARFQIGEKIVEDELAPLIDFYTSRNGPGDRFRALYIKIQQAEEKIHADFFKRYTAEVFSGDEQRMTHLREGYCNTDDKFSAPFRRFFTERIPQTLRALRGAHTLPSATAREIAAISCYHILAEGTVAETAYFGFRKALRDEQGGDTLPTILKAIGMIAKHESTHIAFGVLRLRELCHESYAQKGRFLYNLALAVPNVIGIVLAVHNEHPKGFPFPLNQLALALEGVKQFTSRVVTVLGGSRGSSLE